MRKYILILLISVLLLSCTKAPVCGNGIAETGETSENCCADAGCNGNCTNNKCIPVCGACEVFDGEKCVKVACCADSECNDNNPDTSDLCANPGKLSANCTYVTCQNECEAGSAQCIDNAYRTCANLDTDSCLEWGAVSECKNGCSNNKCTEKDTIFIAVDKNNSDHLTTRISRFAQDLENDGYATVLKVYENTIPENLRQDIKGVYENSKLVGIIFIGDIPYRRILDSYPSDAFYRDLYGKCDYLNYSMVADSLTKKCFFALSSNYNEFWIGRIKSPDDSLLLSYFDRNHEYRTGNAVYEKMLALLDPNNDGFLDSVEAGELFKRKDVKVIAPEGDECSYDDEFITELHNPYLYVYIDAYGTATTHKCNITSEIIGEAEPKAMFYEFRSNAAGDFSKRDYLAGWYVFSGGLAADAPQKAMSGGDVDELFHMMLARGVSIGSAKMLTGSGLFSLIGDPTLRFPRTVNTKAQISLNVSVIDFGSVQPCTYFENVNMYDSCKRTPVLVTIKNTGQDILHFRSFSQFKYINYPGRAYVGSLVSDKYELVPYESTTAKAYFLPPGKGNYSGVYVIISNSLENPVLEVPFRVTSNS